MEERLRAMEVQMKNASGEELDRLMNSYTRLTHEFELENGYAYKSELMGVLNGLGFTEEDFTKQVATPVSYTHLDVYKRQVHRLHPRYGIQNQKMISA